MINWNRAMRCVPAYTNQDAWIKEELNSKANSLHTERAREAGGYVANYLQLRERINFLVPANLHAIEMIGSSSKGSYLLGRFVSELIGYRLELATDGSTRFSGHRLLKLTKPSYEDFPGVTFPEDYKVFKAVDQLDLGTLSLSRRLKLGYAALFNLAYHGKVQEEIDTLLNGDFRAGRDLLELATMNKEQLKAEGVTFSETNDGVGDDDLAAEVSLFSKYLRGFNKIWEDFDSYNEKCQNIARILAETSKPHINRPIDITGKGSASRFVPLADWFSSKIQETVTIEKVLSIFPEAERNMTAIHFGRTVAGRFGQRYTDGKTQPVRYRGMPIWVESQGGSGKSTFVGYMTEALQYLGYSYGALPTDYNAGFGYGDAANSDFTYSDDASVKSISLAIMSPEIKSLVSNSDNFVSHDKGKKHTVTPHPSCTALFITNRLPNSLNFVDGGSRSRCMFMRLHTLRDDAAKEFTAQYNLPFAMNEAIEQMAKDCQTTPQMIVVYFLRLCLDKFLSFGSTEELMAYQKQQMAAFKINLENDHNKQLMMHVLNIWKRCGIEVKRFDGMMFFKTLAYSAMNYFDPADELTHAYKWARQNPGMSTDPDQLLDLMKLWFAAKASVPAMFKQLSDNVVSDTGLNYFDSVAAWNQVFSECIMQSESYVGELDEKIIQATGSLKPTMRHEQFIKDLIIR